MSTPETRLIDQKISDSIDSACQKLMQDGPRKHIGASVIGHNCKAYIWLHFRWAKWEVFSGRMLRLFDRGNEEENRVKRWFNAAGITILDTQAKFSSCNGHFGGSCDGIIQLPAVIGYDEPILWECKTYKDGSDWKALWDKRDLVLSNKKHFSQMCVYGLKLGLNYGLYTAVNKNNDQIYYEFLKLDHVYGQSMGDRANEIINSQEMPQGLGKSKAYFECKMCNFCGICYDGEKLEKNCRSCKNAKPVENGEWDCALYGLIPKAHIINGCDNWESVK